MSAFDDAFHVLEDSRWLRFKRDMRLAVWLLTFLWRFMTTGAKIRKAYRAKKAAGEFLYID